MITYLTPKEYEAIYYSTEQKEKKYGDKLGRELTKLITQWVNSGRKLKFKETGGYSHTDIIVTKVDNLKTNIHIENKYRFNYSIAQIPLDNDKKKRHIINTDKYYAVMDEHKAGNNDCVFLMSIYPIDGQIWVSNITRVNANPEFKERYLNKTTNGRYDGLKEIKYTAEFLPDFIYYFCYQYDSETNTYTLMLSKEKPFDVKLMNALLDTSICLF